MSLMDYLHQHSMLTLVYVTVDQICSVPVMCEDLLCVSFFLQTFAPGNVLYMLLK